MSKNLDLRLYLVLDPLLCGGFAAAVAVAQQSLINGVTILQLRAPSWKKKAKYQLGMALKPICQHYRVPLIINDDVDLALALDADGVHVGQDDLAPGLVRQLLGAQKIIGLSVTSLTDLQTADNQLVDYLGIGPVFATATKTDAAPALGFAQAEAIVAAGQLPNVLIGGLKLQHVAAAKQTGTDGVCVVSAICAAADPAAATKQLITQWNHHEASI